MKSWYDQEEDILNIQLKKDEYWKSIELNDIIIDLTKNGKIMAIEILNASEVFKNSKEVLKPS